MAQSKFRPIALWSFAFFLMFYWTYADLPQQLSTQYGLDGRPVTFMSKDLYIALMGFVIFVLNVSFFGARFIITPSTFKHWISIPFKNHWIQSDELLMDGMIHLDRSLYWGGTGVNILMVFVHIMIMNANGLRTLVPITLNQFLALTICWIVVYFIFIFRLFKPKGFHSGGQ